MGQKKEVKLEDIANQLGVSIVSVSNALKGKKGVSENLRLKVQNVARQMEYTLPGSFLHREQKSYQIGVIVAERYVKEYPSFYMEIYKQIAKAATKISSLTVLEVVDIEKEKLSCEFQIFREAPVQGILIIGEMNALFIKKVMEMSLIPIVCVDFYGVASKLDFIVTDSYHGMQQVMRKLIEYGHEDIGFIGTPLATNSIMDRYLGYCKVLCQKGIKERPERVIFDRSKDGYDYTIDFSLPQDLPTAFVCNCEKSAQILISKLNRRGIKIPEEISVAGFDSSYANAREGITLTTYQSDEKAMALISVNTLLKRIEGKKKPEGVRIVEGRVIEGNTIAKRKA
ncbi:LacI family DNA-binding transcriptional regulator [Lachnospiraceae bacterium ZAX-1]